MEQRIGPAKTRKLPQSIQSPEGVDLILLDADPLENIENTRTIAAVVSRGRLIERSALQHVLSEIADSAATWAGVPTGR